MAHTRMSYMFHTYYVNKYYFRTAKPQDQCQLNRHFWLDYLFHKQRLFNNIIAVMAVRYYLKYGKRSCLSEW